MVVTYLQFQIQVCFPFIGQPVDHAQLATPTVTVTDTLVVLYIIVMIYVGQNFPTLHYHCFSNFAFSFHVKRLPDYL